MGKSSAQLRTMQRCIKVVTVSSMGRDSVMGENRRWLVIKEAAKGRALRTTGSKAGNLEAGQRM